MLALPVRPHRLRAGLLLLALLGLATSALAQTSSIRGQVLDAGTKAPLPGASVVIVGTTQGAATNVDGEFTIEGVAPGTYVLQASFLGFGSVTKTDIVVQTSRPTQVIFELQFSAVEVGEAVVEASAFSAPSDAPTSVQVLGAEEVRRTPGGQNDISRTLLSLPGVTSGVDNRNDLLVRGGGPGENAYYLDGIRIPQINHFATQGVSGGALGLLNVDFIRETTFYRGGYPVRYGDALSSVLLIDNRAGSPDRLSGDFTVGSVESALTLDGPLGGQANWLLSVRRSYVQWLLEALGLPIRPSYWDAQTRVEFNPSPRNRFTFIGIGALDDLQLVQPDPDDDDIERQDLFDSILDNDQRSYTVGGTWRHLIANGFFTVALSRSMSDYRFADIDKEGVEATRNTSVEAENRLRADGEVRLSPRWSVGAGAGAVYAQLETTFFERARPGTNFSQDLNFRNDFTLWKTFAYTQATARLAQERLTLTGGLRVDGNSFVDDGFYVSPRVSAVVALAPTWTFNVAVGRFNQSPSYLALGVRDEAGAFVNQSLPYIETQQYVAGLAWQARPSLRISVEGFYKDYDQYPISASDPRISLANLGADFGFIGAEPLLGAGDGQAYGVEVFAQKKLVERFYFLGAYTLSWSEFAGADGILRPSNWDARHNLSLTGGYRLGQKWEIGAKLRVLTGRPFTPFDAERSADEYALTGRGVPDYDLLNTEQLPYYQRLDIRVDRRFAFSRWNAVVYLDLQNVLARNNIQGFSYTEDPAIANNLRPDESTALLPTFGFSVEW